jgi:xeroderma pigmentosum group C-complementing protein
LAEAEARDGEKMLQGLYSEAQTDWIIPPPIVDGVIPKNAYGNMDVYTPSMVPVGAVHIPRRGTMRICKKLGIDFAEAVTGFEFGARMAIPIITGVVVAEENEEMVMEQWRVDEAERLRKEDEKRTKAALGTWRKFLMGLRIVERVREEYGDGGDEEEDELNPFIRKSNANNAENLEDEARKRIMDQHEEDMAGGFFPEGHNEEEPAQSFFPTSQVHEDDDDGGFIIEGHEPTSSKKKMNGAASYATPVSMQSKDNKAATHQTEEETAEEEHIAPSSRKRKLDSNSPLKPSPKNKKPTPSRSKVKTPAKAAVPKKAPVSTSKARGKRKIVPASDSDEAEDEDEDEESSLSDPESAISAEATTLKSRRRASLPDKGTSKRVVPKRSAARKSETALRSHYFEQNDEDEDEEQ